MKLYLAVLSNVLLSVGCLFGQGTVFFANDSGTLSSPPDRLIRFEGVPAVGTNYQVQLYYGAAGAVEGSLVPVASAPARLRASTTTIPGVWSGGGDRTLTGFNFGQTVTLQVRLWNINFGSSYEAASVNPNYQGFIGRSAAFTYNIPASAANPPADFFMTGYAGFNIVIIPEPSTFALAGLGAAALLIFRRRK